MAAGDEDHRPVVQPHPHLMRVDAGVDRFRLVDLRTRRRIGIDPVDPDAARIAERDQQVLGGNVGRHVDRPGRQRDRSAMRRQCPGNRVDAKRGHMVFVAGRTHP